MRFYNTNRLIPGFNMTLAVKEKAEADGFAAEVKPVEAQVKETERLKLRYMGLPR